MAKWSEDHVVAIGPLKLNSVLVVRFLAKLEDWVGPLGGKGRTIG
jgi:hypothetical protein